MSVANRVSGNRLTQQTPDTDSQLNKEDIEYILGKIREMQFKGTELETLTRVVIKLQAQHAGLSE